ncbi:MAG: RES domain-containing protein [Arenicellales bacterium IbO2]|nr:RES domain-containing protein [Gammaproteobacteria bacterium]MDA8006922.1 RES domain-containing protein [Gammaproteobacteria bacterium]MDA8024869.1 RES domain-containing protein [Gammaproteobacteria bacterium]CAJ2376592.1 MAG: RES domain-containing protein [Arenicellales bacterium IbO2]
MTQASRLTRPLIAYRFGDPADIYPTYSAQGAAKNPGRWNERGDAVIYASERYATAMLEKLAYLNGVTPPKQFFIKITIPSGVSFEAADAKKLKGWNNPDCVVAREFGHAWYAGKRSAVLFVPSVVAPVERNIVINAKHPDFPRIKPGRKTRVKWDERLFPKHTP